MAMSKDRRERLQFVRGILNGLFGVVPMENKTAVKSALNAIEFVLEEDEEENDFCELMKKQRYIAHPDGRIEPIPSIAYVKAVIARKIFAAIYETCFDQYGRIDYDALDKLRDKYTWEADQ
jgi:hypothetical protein